MIRDAFIYQDFQIDNDKRTVRFAYTLQHASKTYNFTETLEFPVPLLNSPAQHACLRALHIALGISYYKIFAPGTIAHPYKMDAGEAEFWNDIWRNGLGEFLYVNKLSPTMLARFSAQPGASVAATPNAIPAEKSSTALLGIGGGKDSIVAREILGACNVDVQGFVMATGEQLGQAKDVSETMQVPLHVVKRGLDSQLLSVQEQPGAYKGHIPISLIFGLVGTALAIATGSKYVVVANEASASIPRGIGGELAVNHQWSKSFGFEQKLQRYLHQGVDPDVTYFSAVRQLTSVGVAKIFARFPKYYEVFTSDNFVFRIDPSRRPNGRWSLESPKSLSSFILLAPWISEADMLRIFGLNFMDQSSLEPLFLALIGVEGEPPLDCVGTVEELVLSLNLSVAQGKFTETALTQLAQRRGIITTDKDWQTELAHMLALQPEHALPDPLSAKITTELQKELHI